MGNEIYDIYSIYSDCLIKTGPTNTHQNLAIFQKSFIPFSIYDDKTRLEYLDNSINFKFVLSGKTKEHELSDIYYINYTDRGLTDLARKFSIAIMYLYETVRKIKCKKTRGRYLHNLAFSEHIPLFRMDCKKMTATAAIQRLCDPTIVRKKLRRHRKEAVMHREQCIGFHTYTSPVSVAICQEQNKRNQEFLKSKIVKKDDYEVCLADITRGYYERFCEMNAMNKVMDEVAEDEGFLWVMITLTAPPEYHSNPSEGKNSWNGATVRDAHDKIHELYELSTKALGRKLVRGEDFWGIRVVEPHKDGTPHWHCLIYIHPDNVDTLKDSFRKYFNWHKKRAVDFKVQDLSLPKYSKELFEQGVRKFRSSGAGYIIKYIVKNIAQSAEELKGSEWAELMLEDHLNDNKEGADFDTVMFSHAWRQSVGIRAWGRLGTKGKVGLVREARRLKQRVDQDELELNEHVKSILEELWNDNLREFLEKVEKQPKAIQVWRKQYTNEFGEKAYKTMGIKGLLFFNENGELLNEDADKSLIAKTEAYYIKTRGFFSILEKEVEQEKHRSLSEIKTRRVSHMVPSSVGDTDCAAYYVGLAEVANIGDLAPPDLDNWEEYENFVQAA